MAKDTVWRSPYFYGVKISQYGIEHGYVDYKTLASAFNHILSNDLIEKTAGIGWWDIVNGEPFDEYGNEREVFQWYIVDDNGADILTELTDEIVYYNDDLDLYVWGVTHFGTSWDYVLTDIRIEVDEG